MPIRQGWVHLNGHLLAAVDIETTGKNPVRHEIIQIGIQPLDSNCEPLSDVSPFYNVIKPEHPKRADPKASQVHKLDIDYLNLHAPDKWMVADWLDEWFTNLELPHKKSLAPVAQSWQFEACFLKAWLGVESFEQFFHWDVRDVMRAARTLSDRAYLSGKSNPFPRLGLEALCTKFGVINENPHDALADARAEAAVYKKLMEFLE